MKTEGFKNLVLLFQDETYQIIAEIFPLRYTIETTSLTGGGVLILWLKRLSRKQ